MPTRSSKRRKQEQAPAATEPTGESAPADMEVEAAPATAISEAESSTNSSRLENIPQDAVDISGDGGLFKRILKAGDEDSGSPPDGDEVQVHYTGTLMDGTKFDSSRDRPGNFSFKIGEGSVIKGWDVGVATMKRGELSELYCRADYAYGASGSPPKIPPNATLKFEVELLDWAPPKKEKWELSAKEKIEEAAKLKAEATEHFKEGRFMKARLTYADAASYVSEDYDFSEEEDKAKAKELMISCHLNEAQCCLKDGEWRKVQSLCTEVEHSLS